MAYGRIALLFLGQFRYPSFLYRQKRLRSGYDPHFGRLRYMDDSRFRYAVA